MTIAVIIIAIAAGILTWAILAAERREERKKSLNKKSTDRKD